VSETCFSCRHWAQADQRDDIGHCRRHAPHPTLVNGYILVNWPVTRDCDWCGEHAKRATGYSDREAA
jgi:hypothetical protein